MNNSELEIEILLLSIFRTCLNMDLHDAVKEGDLERVKSLVEQGVDKDMVGDHGLTSLNLASWKNHLLVVQYLIEQGASLDKADNTGQTSLSGAAHCGHLELTRYLLEQGADRDKADNDGMTPLHFAAQHGHLETAMLLMSYGADLNATTHYDELPIDLAGTEEIKQAIRDEPRRRMDHGLKRATEQDRHPNAVTSASAQQEDEEGEEQSYKQSCLDEGTVAKETKVAEEDEDSEPSDEGEEDT